MGEVYRATDTTLAAEETPPDYRLDLHVILGWAQAAKLLP